MARVEYVRHVVGDKLARSMVLVFQDYYEILDEKLGYVWRTDPLSGVKSKEKVKFRVRVFDRNGGGAGVRVREYRLSLSYPLAKLV